MTTARRLHHSYEDYLAALAVSGIKLEYCDGEIPGSTWPSTMSTQGSSSTRLEAKGCYGALS